MIQNSTPTPPARRHRALHALIAGLTLLSVAAISPGASPRPQAPTALLSHAAELEKAQDHAGAEKIYRQALLESPDDPEVLKALGAICQEQGKFDESIEFLQRILKRAPLYPGVNSLLGVSYYALNQFDKTIEVTQTELRGNPKDVPARYYLALALTSTGRFVEAIHQLESLSADEPQNLAVQYQLVVDYKSAGQQAGQRLAKMAPGSEFTHALKAETFSDEGRLDEAILEFKEVLRINPDFPGVHFALGEIYWRKMDTAKATELLQLALQEDPNQPLGNYYVGDMLVEQRKFQDAMPHLKIALSVYPELARAHFLMGKCYAGTGELQAALQEYNGALKLFPDFKEAHFQLYQLYARLGDKEKSQEHLRISEKLTREEHDTDKALVQQSLEKQRDLGTKP
jgi:tetratricopeptide (TPR) repeat protein